MNNTNEAAADEQACIKWAERHYRNDEWFESIELSVALNAWHQACAYARAALKAQPAPTEAPPTLQPVDDPLTERKTIDIISRGYKKVGYVLENEAGDYCLSAQHAVRWLAQPHYWRLMHEQDGSLFGTRSPTEEPHPIQQLVDQAQELDMGYGKGEDGARVDAQVTAAARVLANRSADQCGVNREVNWKVYSQDFIDDARAVLEAARAAPQPQEKP